MKKLVLIHFILLPVYGFSQHNSKPYTPINIESQPVAVNFKTGGYIGGIRPNSMDARFAEFNTGIDKVSCDYGQSREKRKQLDITDNMAKPLLFPITNMAFMPNFFYLNGWQPAQTYVNQGQSLYMLKKN